MFTQEKRLKIWQEDFYTDPIKAIQSFIGIDAEIISYNVNNIYIDGYNIVDVKYKHLDLDPTRIYWVKLEDCKLLNINQTSTYITKIEGINVCVIVNQQYDKNKWLPVHIDITIPNNRGSDGLFRYFAKIVDSPFHECNTQIFNHNHKQLKEDLSKCNKDKVLFDKDTTQHSYDVINNTFSYKATVQSITTQELTRINSLEEATDKNKLYLIDVRNIKEPEKYKGFIACSQYREHPWDVMFIAIPNFKLTNKKLEYLKWFMYMDYCNYEEWLDKCK